MLPRFLATGGNEIFQRYNELVIATSDISYGARAGIYSHHKRSIIFRYNVPRLQCPFHATV